MNVLLLEAAELDTSSEPGSANGVARIVGRRAEHVRKVLGKAVGDTLRIGVLGGNLGTGTIESLTRDELVLRCGGLATAPPAKRALTLVLALPRPPVLRRVLAQVTSLGVERIVLLHTRRVEKSYWQSPSLAADNLREYCVLGLEQAVDTVLPHIEFARAFRPFVEDVLPELDAGATLLVADPSGGRACPVDVTERCVLLVGPEGGFIPFELELLAAQGVECVTLGPRILRVETAVVALLARLGLG